FPYATPPSTELWPSAALVGAVPEQPFILAGADKGRQHLGAGCRGRGIGRPIGYRDDRPNRLAKALVGVGVDPRLIRVLRRCRAGDRAADIPIDPEAGQ